MPLASSITARIQELTQALEDERARAEKEIAALREAHEADKAALEQRPSEAESGGAGEEGGSQSEVRAMCRLLPAWRSALTPSLQPALQELRERVRELEQELEQARAAGPAPTAAGTVEDDLSRLRELPRPEVQRMLQQAGVMEEKEVILDAGALEKAQADAEVARREAAEAKTVSSCLPPCLCGPLSTPCPHPTPRPTHVHTTRRRRRVVDGRARRCPGAAAPSNRARRARSPA